MDPSSHEVRSQRWVPFLTRWPASGDTERARNLSRAALSMIAVLLVAVALVAGFVGLKLGVHYRIDQECCQLPLSRSLLVTAKEKLGLVTFYSQTGEDKWVSEAVFPGVKNGFFMDVGSGDGTFISNTKALEQKGWTTSEWGTSDNNRRARFYSITRAGRKQLAVETKTWERTVAMMTRMLEGES